MIFEDEVVISNGDVDCKLFDEARRGDAGVGMPIGLMIRCCGWPGCKIAD